MSPLHRSWATSPEIQAQIQALARLELLKRQESMLADAEGPANALRERIMADLLPYQTPVVDDRDHRIVGFVAGYGSGKTRTMCAWATICALDNPNTMGALFAPTGPLVRDVVQRAAEEFWDSYGIPFVYRASPLPEYELQLPQGNVTIICRSMESWQRVIGVELSFLGADEVDTTKTEIAQRAIDKFLGRLRAGQRRQLGLFSTPEGFGTLWNLFVREGDKPDRALYRGRTAENPYLPADYLDALLENYSPALCKAYTEGLFTNLTQAGVYPDFDRAENVSEISEPAQDDVIFVGMDFNVGRSWMVCVVQRGTDFHVFRELIGRDTPDCIEQLRTHFAPWIEAGQLIVCPDSSSMSRSTQNAGQSDFGLIRQAGMRTVAQPSNPFIRDRVLTVNTLILNASGNRRLKVHPGCEGVLQGLEQHAYNMQTQQPEKGDGGVMDLSGQMDAMGYALWYLAGIRHGQVHTQGSSWGRGSGQVNALVQRHPAPYLHSVPEPKEQQRWAGGFR